MATRGFVKTSAWPRMANSGRRVVDHLQRVRIVSLADGNKRDVELAARVDFPFGGFARADFRDDATAAAARQCRQGFECRARIAKMFEERAERPWTDILAADEPQPIQPLFIGQTDRFRPRAHLAPKSAQENPLRPKPITTPKHLYRSMLENRRLRKSL